MKKTTLIEIKTKKAYSSLFYKQEIYIRFIDHNNNLIDYRVNSGRKIPLALGEYEYFNKTKNKYDEFIFDNETSSIIFLKD